MKYKALVSFSGILSMAQGEVGDISDPALVKDLLKAGYITEIPDEKSEKKEKGSGGKPRR